MNTSTQKAERLTESDIHAVCDSMLEAGERPASLAIYEKLGRGSMGTISKHFKSWRASHEEAKIAALPAVVELPASLASASDELIKKVWLAARNSATSELEAQRAALAAVEADINGQLAESIDFSERQAEQLDATRETSAALTTDKANTELKLAELASTHDALVIVSNEQAQSIKSLTDTNSTAKSALEAQEAENKQLTNANKALDLQVHKLQSSLDLSVNSTSDLKKELVELRLNSKTTESLLSDSVAVNKSLTAQIIDLKAAVSKSAESLESANNRAIEAGKLASELSGKLAGVESQSELYQSYMLAVKKLDDTNGISKNTAEKAK